MSDADDADFDKEAERERLREKYEEDQADREAAQQMSDLLLKGATMTNAHCGACGSPIFRHDGQEFCPNCSGATSNGIGTDEPRPEAEDTTADETAEAQTTEAASPDERLAEVVASDADDGDVEDADGTSMAERAAAAVRSADRQDPPAQPATPTDGATGGQAPSGSATLADAQQSLLTAIVTHASAAAEADPRTAGDHLAAANEAAEALAEITPEE